MKLLLQGQELPVGDDGDLRAVVLMSSARGDADLIELEVDDSDVVEIETEDGDRLMVRADQLAERLPGSIVVSRDGTSTGALMIRREVTLEIPPEFAAMAPTRSAVGWLIRRLLLRRPDASTPDLAGQFENLNPNLGLNLWQHDATLVPVQGVLEPDPGQQDQPWLLFLHGTGSSTTGSFGKLPGKQGEIWQALQLAYGGRVLTFDHRSLTEDPVQNLLTLLDRLPQGIELHLVSHSRGGLIGELLALGHLAEPKGGSVLQPSDLALFEGAARDRLAELGKRLAQQQIRVTRFLRVACPVRGTRIADGRLGDWLGLVFNALARSARILGEAPAEHAEALARVASAALASRDNPEALPGVAAMAPEFSPLVKMLNNGERKLRAGVSDGLVVIAGDLEFSMATFRLMLFFVDCFYGSDHDLVVNTSLMEGGLPRDEPLVLLDRGPSVTHFGYFGNARSAGQLRDGLLARDRLRGTPSPLRQLAEAETRGRDIARTIVPGSDPDKPALVVVEELAAPTPLRSTGRPLAVILPGISGSHLAVAGQRVWLNPAGICLGGVGRLDIARPQVGPDGVIEIYYGGLREHLRRTHETLTLAYDWRLPVQTTGTAVARIVLDKLGSNPQRPVHIVGHSMGGLVARAALTDPALMRAFLAHPESRFLMAGTPNGGSLAMALGLLGHSSTVKMLAALSLSEDVPQITAIMRKWPGAVQLLPPELLETATWQALAGKQPLDGNAIAGARDFWRRMRGDAGLPPGRCLYLAGMGKTCDRLFSVALAGQAPDLRMTTTTRGDGTVLWATGIPAGVPSWYAPSEHGDLCKDRYLHPAISDLLLQGRTEVPRVTREPGLRGAAPVAPGPVQRADEPLPIVPSPLQLLAATMGGRPPALLESAAPPAADVQVRVVHDDLRNARHPILVGHGLGEAIRSAEQALDRRLNGRLTRRNALGLHPGLVGTWDAHVFADPRAEDGIAGGIVVGTGVMSKLNTAELTAAIRAGLLAYADAVGDLLPPPAATAADADAADPPAGRCLRVSAVLIGSGTGVVSVADSVSALLNGVEQANRILASQTGDGPAPRFVEMQIIEAVEQVAVTAWHALGQRITRMRDPFQRLGPLVQGEGGYRRTGPEADPDSWMEVTITVPPPAPDMPLSALGSLHYLLVDGRARVEARTVATSRRLVQDYVAQIPTQPAALDASGMSPGRTLFELLWPAELKQHSLEDRNLRLVLDRESATIPWEMLDDRRPDDLGRYAELLKPPAVRYGLMRQLVSQRSLPTPARRGGPRTALVIGDPSAGDGRLPALPNARDEALAVAEQLKAAGFQVTTLIGADAAPTQVVSALFSRGWSVIHVASHGVVDWRPTPDDPPMTGILLGAPPLAVLQAPLLRQLPEPPDMVFLNCCHLGLVSAGDPLGLALHQDRPGFAASMAVELIEMGCSAVVACGWAVDDSAAKSFAQSLYQLLCDGADYGSALRQARAQAWVTSGLASNTWAAYQCYGHPGFVLIPTTTERHGEGAELASPSEALSQIRAEIARRDAPGQRPLADRLADLEKRIDRHDWHRLSDIAAALGDGWLACGDTQRAAEAYRHALAAERPSLSLSSLQHSAALLDSEDRQHPDAWISLIRALNDACQPSLERHILLVRLYLRRATEATKAQRQTDMEHLTTALQDALTMAERDAGADPDRADALRLQLLLVLALSSSPPKDLKARFAVLLAHLGGSADLAPLLALTRAVVHGDPAALPAPAALRDPQGLQPLARLAQAALAPGSALRPALREAMAP